MSSGIPTRSYQNQHTQLQRIARKMKCHIVTNLDSMLYKKQITKALIRLCRCAGWSVPLLLAHHKLQDFLRQGPFYIQTSASIRLW